MPFDDARLLGGVPDQAGRIMVTLSTEAAQVRLDPLTPGDLRALD